MQGHRASSYHKETGCLLHKDTGFLLHKDPASDVSGYVLCYATSFANSLEVNKILIYSKLLVYIYCLIRQGLNFLLNGKSSWSWPSPKQKKIFHNFISPNRPVRDQGLVLVYHLQNFPILTMAFC